MNSQRECALFLIQVFLYNSLLELLLACHIHVAMSTSFIKGVRDFHNQLLKLCYLMESGHEFDSFHSLLSQAEREMACCCHQGGRHQDKRLPQFPVSAQLVLLNFASQET